MSDILQKINPENMPAIIDANLIAYRSWLCTSCRGQLHQEPGVLWAESEPVNAVLHMDPQENALPAAIERVRNHFAQRNRGFQWFLGPSARQQHYADALLAHGLEHDEEEPGMAVELQALQEDIPLASHITILPVSNHELLEQWIRVWLFPVPEEFVRQIIAAHASVPLGANSPLQFYLGLVDGQPVATVCVFYNGSVASIHYVVTLPERRHQGIGGAMTLMAAREARARGYRVAVLTASSFGINIYRRLGFREYGTFNTYIWNPQKDQA